MEICNVFISDVVILFRPVKTKYLLWRQAIHAKDDEDHNPDVTEVIMPVLP